MRSNGGVDRRRGRGGGGQERMGDGSCREWGRGRVILCSQDWPAGVDLYWIKSDNQLSVKGIVLSCDCGAETGSAWTGRHSAFHHVTPIYTGCMCVPVQLSSLSGSEV